MADGIALVRTVQRDGGHAGRFVEQQCFEFHIASVAEPIPQGLFDACLNNLLLKKAGAKSPKLLRTFTPG